MPLDLLNSCNDCSNKLANMTAPILGNVLGATIVIMIVVLALVLFLYDGQGKSLCKVALWGTFIVLGIMIIHSCILKKQNNKAIIGQKEAYMGTSIPIELMDEPDDPMVPIKPIKRKLKKLHVATDSI